MWAFCAHSTALMLILHFLDIFGFGSIRDPGKWLLTKNGLFYPDLIGPFFYAFLMNLIVIPFYGRKHSLGQRRVLTKTMITIRDCLALT